MRRKFWATVLLQVVILLAIAAMQGYTLLTGQAVLLKTVPVDPWDPFRGEYVDLNYEITRLPDTLPMAGGPYEPGQRVWVTLRQGEPYWSAVALSAQRPQTGANEVALRGRVRWTEGSYGGAPGFVVIRYGIEQFYVPEGQGRELQGQVVDMSVEARVDRFGRAGLKTVFLEGEPIIWR